MRQTAKLGLMLVMVLTTSMLLLLGDFHNAQGQNQITATSTLETSTNIPTPISTPTMMATEDLKATYQEVLDTSKRAVEEVHKTANIILILVGVVFSALTAGGIGTAWLLSGFAQRASDKASTAQQEVSEALNVIQRTETKTAQIEERNNAVDKATNELIQKQNDLRIQIDSSQKLMQVLQSELTQIKNDRKELKRPLTLMLIDDYGMQLLSGNIDEKNKSVVALIEMSSRPDSVIRRRAIKTLGIIEEYDERIVKRMKEIITADSAQGVRKEAEKTLKLIEAKKPKKTTRRKS